MPDTQLICRTDPTCLCLGPVDPEDKYAKHECDCWTGHQRDLFTKECAHCGAPLEEINVDTGEAVAA